MNTECPANVEAEQQLLGAFLQDNNHLNFVASFLEPEHFFVPCHAEVYRTIQNFSREGKVATPISLKPHLTIAPEGGISIPSYLLKLSVNAAAAFNIHDYGRQVLDLAVRRGLMQSAEELRYNAANIGSEDTSTVIDQMEIAAAAARSVGMYENEAPETMQEIGDAYLRDMTEALNGNGIEVPGIGFSDVDRHIGGLYPGCTYVLAGRPGMGKTAMGVCAMMRIARQRRRDKSHYGAVYFSLEVPGADIWARSAAHDIQRRYGVSIDYSAIRQKKGLDNRQAEHVVNIATELKDLPVRICDKGGVTVAQIEARLRGIKAEWARAGQSLDVVFVDHIGLIKPSGRYSGNRVSEMTEISGALLAMSKRLGVAVVELCQLNRAVEARENNRPQLSDLRESGSIEQDANTVIMLFRPEYYDQRDGKETDVDNINRLEAIVAKARDGMPGSVNLYCQIATNFIDNRSRGE